MDDCELISDSCPAGDDISLSGGELGILWHSLGFSGIIGGYRILPIETAVYRNMYYCSPDDPVVSSLVRRGYMIQRSSPWESGRAYFSVAYEYVDILYMLYVHTIMQNRKRITRGKLRYLCYLHCCDPEFMTFGEFLRSIPWREECREWGVK